MNAARRAKQKANARSRHTHVKGERCTRCRPLPRTADEQLAAVQQGVATTWRSSTVPLTSMLSGLADAITHSERDRGKFRRAPQGLRIRRHQAR